MIHMSFGNFRSASHWEGLRVVRLRQKTKGCVYRAVRISIIEGQLFIYSRSQTFKKQSISKESNRTEHEYMTEFPPNNRSAYRLMCNSPNYKFTHFFIKQNHVVPECLILSCNVLRTRLSKGMLQQLSNLSFPSSCYDGYLHLASRFD